ncbi:hypothetical protein [Terasakiella pusilla]|uniref:hypothetical protein n=1 Tax=Terasakiella pusilla TaxID=64973 RepID=UPI003AA9AD14
MHIDCFREVFRNRRALRILKTGEDIKDSDFRQGLLSSLRARMPNQPDYMLTSRFEMAFAQSGPSLRERLIHSLNSLSEFFFTPVGNDRYCVPKDRFALWQDYITDLSPLLLMTWCISSASKTEMHTDAKNWPHDLEELRKYIHRLRAQLRFSALPSIFSPRLDYIIRENGLDDLHVHLNGSTEAELVWRDALQEPNKFKEAFFNKKKNEKIIDQLSHEGDEYDHKEIYHDLCRARILRVMMERQLFEQEEQGEWDKKGKSKLCFKSAMQSPVSSFVDYNENHLNTLIDPVKGDCTDLIKEALFLTLAFKRLREHQDEEFARMFYAYVLIMGLFQRLMIQQSDHWGFDQFQKISDNNIRDTVERNFTHRFKQLAYSEYCDLDRLEGRFAPNPDKEKIKERLTQIFKGYLNFQTEGTAEEEKAKPFKTLKDILEALENPSIESKRLKLSLVCHFIKNKDKYLEEFITGKSDVFECRHASLRRDLEKSRKAIQATRDQYRNLDRYLVGYDVAANELHAGPEVFAPLYRRLRKQGCRYFTYHAGEDFTHLLSGIRTVLEAVEFLDLRTGSRIGHATAIGIDPTLWRERSGPISYVKRGQRLDDLVFARRLLLQSRGLSNLLPLFDDEISTLCNRIYGHFFSPDLLYQAWQHRWYDPLLVFDIEGPKNETITYPLSEEHDSTETYFRQNTKLKELYQLYHGAKDDNKILQAYEEKIEIDIRSNVLEQAIDEIVYRTLQAEVLKIVRAKDITLETLPTSNLRISWYKDYQEHHIFTWLGLNKVVNDLDMGATVCVGSDDPGIFATNLRNEYAHLQITLENLGFDAEKIHSILHGLVRNGKIFRFESLQRP